MALFLISVLKKYLAQQDQIAVDKAYRKYCQYFLNPEIQENIRSIKELNKSDEFEWLDLFEQNKNKAQDLKSQISTIEQQIDTMVYQLYGLSEEEITIMENA